MELRLNKPWRPVWIFNSWNTNFHCLPSCTASSVLLLCLVLRPTRSTASPKLSVSGSSGDWSCSVFPEREMIPPALSPPLGMSRQHSPSSATDTATAWLLMPAAPATTEDSFGFSAVQRSVRPRLSSARMGAPQPLFPLAARSALSPAAKLLLHT